MKNEQHHRVVTDDELRAEARALGESIEAIRKARGKKNPRDFAIGTDEWESTCIEFVNDLRWALASRR